MNLNHVKDVFDEIIGDTPMLYHLNVTTPTEPVRKRELKTSTSFRPDSVKFGPDCKSVIVWTTFSRVGPDYYFKNGILPRVIDRLNQLIKDPKWFALNKKSLTFSSLFFLFSFTG